MKRKKKIQDYITLIECENPHETLNEPVPHIHFRLDSDFLKASTEKRRVIAKKNLMIEQTRDGKSDFVIFIYTDVIVRCDETFR